MIQLGLARILRLVSRHPPKWPAIHIAGTNGKGTVAAYVAGLLNRSGIRAGRFTSPHLIHRWDCIEVAGRAVGASFFLNVEQLIKRRDKKFPKNEGDEGPTSEFELLTATAFEIFNREKVQVAIIECGMGGARDATNVLGQPDLKWEKRGGVLCSVITRVGLDHQQFLGSTVEEIAREKAGVIKKGKPCFVDGENEKRVIDVVEEYAREVGGEGQKSLVHVVGTQALTLKESKAFEEMCQAMDFEPHQKANLKTAVEVLKHIKDNTRLGKFMHGTIVTLISQVPTISWPGRLQQVYLEHITGRKARVLLDGAHNVQSALALANHVDRRWRQKDKPVTWLVAFSEGKKIEEMIWRMIHRGDNVIATTFGLVDGMPWVKNIHPGKILSAAKRKGMDHRDPIVTEASGDTRSALKLASDIAKEGPLVIAGSLYLVSDVLRLLREVSNLRKATQSRPIRRMIWPERWKMRPRRPAAGRRVIMGLRQSKQTARSRSSLSRTVTRGRQQN
jgi:dihydrofolate synthase